MNGTKGFEFKVGIFTLIGLSIVFLIVFSIGDINLSRAGYRINVVFHFVAGIGSSAPVRLAGVDVGHVERVTLIRGMDGEPTRAEVTAWIESDAEVENDARVTINQLGLLGEKYLEIFPGTVGKPFLKEGDTIAGVDPVPVEKMTDNLAQLAESVTTIVGRLERGEGTIGKLLTEDDVYDNVKSLTANLDDFSRKLDSGEGTLGKLLTEDELYRELQSLVVELQEFARDLKAHPWKLLSKPRGQR